MRNARASKGREIRDTLLRRILEALRQLEALHFVDTMRYRGTRVREIAATEMRDAYYLRALIEREAASAAAAVRDAEWSALRAAVLGIERVSGNAVLQRHWDLLLVPTRILVVLRSGTIDLRETAKEHRPRPDRGAPLTP